MEIRCCEFLQSPTSFVHNRSDEKSVFIIKLVFYLMHIYVTVKSQQQYGNIMNALKHYHRYSISRQLRPPFLMAFSSCDSITSVYNRSDDRALVCRYVRTVMDLRTLFYFFFRKRTVGDLQKLTSHELHTLNANRKLTRIQLECSSANSFQRRKDPLWRSGARNGRNHLRLSV